MLVHQGFPSTMIDGIAEFYPYVINHMDDLECFIVQQIPPASKTDANAGLVDGNELLEQFSNIQVMAGRSGA